MGLFTSKQDRILKQRLKHYLFFTPKKLFYYKIALSHKSKPFLLGNKKIDNETMEFLGDAVLNLVATRYLYLHYPNMDEGELSRMRSALVSRTQLNKTAKRMHLSKFLKRTHETNIRQHVSGNTLEALFGAIFLDKGYKQAEKFFEELIKHNYIIAKEFEENNNYKSILLEKAAKEKFSLEFSTKKLYINNNLFFKSFIFVNKRLFAEGLGKKKKTAERRKKKGN